MIGVIKMRKKLLNIKPIKNLQDTLVGRSFILFLITMLICAMIFMLHSVANAGEKKKGYSTLPGWSAGYRYLFDLDNNDDDKLRLFGKYKQRSGNIIKFGIDIKHRNSVKNGAIFIEQEFKF